MRPPALAGSLACGSYHETLGSWVEDERTVGGDDYIRLSLATHSYRNGKRVTCWHKLLVFDPERGNGRFPARLARTGAKVEVTGRWQRFWRDGQKRFVFHVESLRILEAKVRAAA